MAPQIFIKFYILSLIHLLVISLVIYGCKLESQLKLRL